MLLVIESLTLWAEIKTWFADNWVLLLFIALGGYVFLRLAGTIVMSFVVGGLKLLSSLTIQLLMWLLGIVMIPVQFIFSNFIIAIIVIALIVAGVYLV